MVRSLNGRTDAIRHRDDQQRALLITQHTQGSAPQRPKPVAFADDNKVGVDRPGFIHNRVRCWAGRELHSCVSGRRHVVEDALELASCVIEQMRSVLRHDPSRVGLDSFRRFDALDRVHDS